MKKSTFVLVACILSMSVFAQKSNFSGNWIFKEQESVSGKLYVNGSPKQISIKQKEGTIDFEKVSAGANGDVTTKETVEVGKAYDYVSATKRKRSISITWSAGGDSFTTVTKLFKDEAGTQLFHIVTDTYTLEYGGLVLKRKDENKENGEVWESKALYEK